MTKRIELAGLRFGALSVIGIGKSSKVQQPVWKCVCDCGKELLVIGQNLRSGASKSCGCMLSEKRKENSTVHGYTKHQCYQVWYAMMRRCHDPKEPAYFKGYGERGIVVCDRWHNFENFLADMGERPSSDLSIDRIDTNGNYEPSNCRWATREEQNRNRRDNVYIELDGVRMIIKDWATALKTSANVIRGRIKSGWSIRDSLTTPVGSRTRWSNKS